MNIHKDIYNTSSSTNQQKTLSDKEWAIRKVNQMNALLADTTLSSHAKVIAGRLILSHYNNKTGRCDPAETTLSKDTGIALRTVERATKQLRDEN